MRYRKPRRLRWWSTRLAKTRRARRAMGRSLSCDWLGLAQKTASPRLGEMPPHRGFRKAVRLCEDLGCGAFCSLGRRFVVECQLGVVSVVVGRRPSAKLRSVAVHERP